MKFWNFSNLSFSDNIGVINFNAEFNGYLKKKKKEGMGKNMLTSKLMMLTIEFSSPMSLKH